MSAWVIVDTQIENAEAYEEYKQLAKPIAERYGGIYRVRGGPIDIIESGLWSPTRIVLVEFPDRAAARAFIDSAEYAPVKKIRQANARCTLIIIDGN